MSDSPSLNPPSTSGFTRRLGYILLGLAIGTVLVGLFQAGRSKAAERQREQQAAQPGR